MALGNLADNHPEIVDIILFGAAMFILPEYALLRPIARLFGISPIGPVKGSFLGTPEAINYYFNDFHSRLSRCLGSKILLRWYYSSKKLVL
jgi:hypothetical protein